MKTILVDTNILMSIGQFKLDIFSELEKVCDFRYKIKILNGTITELNKIIQEQKGKHQLNAKLALDIINKKKIEILDSGDEQVDDLLVKLAEQGAIIATQDKDLKIRIKAVGGKLIVIRAQKRLVFI